ncbi:hypothetical protein Chor_013387 [Crotalus horridus]
MRGWAGLGWLREEPEKRLARALVRGCRAVSAAAAAGKHTCGDAARVNAGTGARVDGCPCAKLWKKVSLVAGGIVGLSLGILTSVYISTLHENDLWFSNIKEVEREISFRTECGLYYSYYKQMLAAPSIQQGGDATFSLLFHGAGLHSLMYDNKTESMRTINILGRMNKFLEPVYFYIYTLFSLQAVYVIALYATSWLLSGTWLSGVLAAAWYIVNSWQRISQKLTLLAVFIATFLLSLTWQFNQFILLIQAMALFTLDCLDMIPKGKVIWLYIIQMGSLLMVYILQFFNPMIIGSLLVSFNMSVLLAGKLQRILNLESDEHIFKFLKAKFGFGATRDFDANLYLCEEAFGLLPLNTFTRLSDTLVFCAYLFVLLITATTAAVVSFQNLSGHATIKPVEKQPTSTTVFKPYVAYHLMHTISFGLLALSTMRMKYLWTSHVSVIRYLTPILVLLYLCYKFLPGIMAELSELREFYDPDTVELMNWIKSNTPEKAVIAGSMQLLAGVKLCTGRILTNHPHYEDKSLRERTKEVMDGPGENDPHLKPSAFPRFCEEIKRNLPSYTMYFTKVFHNKTFHVYKLAQHQNIT